LLVLFGVRHNKQASTLIVYTELIVPTAVVITRVPLTPRPDERETTTYSNVNVDTSLTSGRRIRIRKPIQAGTSELRRRVVHKVIKPETSRLTSLLADEESIGNNAVDAEENISFTGFKVKDDVFSPNINTNNPFIADLLTTFTYYTTVIRGPHTLQTSRETTSSNKITQSFDPTIYDIISYSNGIIKPTTMVDLGTKTKGPTTTIINLKSQIEILNYKPLHLNPTKSAFELTRTRQPVIESAQKGENILNLDQINTIPRTYYTHFDYIYTVYDQLKTVKSSRKEIISSQADEQDNLKTIQLDTTVNSLGLIKIGSQPKTVHLGKRVFGGSTTEVNLGMKTLLKLDGVSNVLIDLTPTEITKHKSVSQILSSSIVSHSHQASASLDTSSTILELSFNSNIESSPNFATPTISASLNVEEETIKPSSLVSSTITRTHSGGLRSRIVISGRPGIRGRRPPFTRVHRIKPSSSLSIDSDSFSSHQVFTPNIASSSIDPANNINSNLISSIVDVSKIDSSFNFDTSSIYESNLVASTIDETKMIEPTATPIFDLTTMSSEVPTATKKKIAVTVRRPFLGDKRSRIRNPLKPSSTTDPKFVVITRSGPVGLVRPTNSRFRIASRIIKSNVAKSSPLIISPTPTVSVEAVNEPSSTVTVNSKGETVSITVTSVPVIFGLKTSYRKITFSSTVSSLATPVLSPSLSSILVTYYQTETHTLPVSVNEKTILTTLEVTKSQVVTELFSSKPYPIEDSKGNVFTKVSDGATLVLSSNLEPSSPVTLLPTLISGASVLMRDGLTTIHPGFDTRTLYTTYTYFTTFYSDTTSIVSSNEQVISNLITIPRTQPVSQTYSTTISPITVVESSEKIDTSTIYSTYTYFATLFNGSRSTITPLEETKTEILTLREPTKITRTIHPSQTVPTKSVFTRTYFTTYTNLVTYYDNNTPRTTQVEETASNIVTFTIPGYSNTSLLPPKETSVLSSLSIIPQILTTKSTYTTLTHYITLFSGTQTILSSIEEVSPTVITQVVGESNIQEIKASSSSRHNIQITKGDLDTNKVSRDLMTALVPSISTLQVTHTYYTTFFNGQTSIVSSRTEATSSLVTLYVPQSVISASSISTSLESDATMHKTSTLNEFSSNSFIENSESVDTNYAIVQATPSLPDIWSSLYKNSDLSSSIATNNDAVLEKYSPSPSLRLESSRYDELESSVLSKAVSDLKSSQKLSNQKISSVLDVGIGKSTTVIGGSTVVFFTELVFNPSKTYNSKDIPVTDSLSGDDEKLISSFISPSQNKPHHGASIQPGAVIELSDLLGSSEVALAGNLGDTIKDIVHLIAIGANKLGNSNKPSSIINRVESTKVDVPAGAVTFMHNIEPVYIPMKISDANKSITSDETSEIIINPVYVVNSLDTSLESTLKFSEIQSSISTPSLEISSSIADLDSNEFSFTKDNTKHSLSSTEPLDSSLVSSSLFSENKVTPKAVFTQVSSDATTIFLDDVADSSFVNPTQPANTAISTKYITSIESMTRTLTLTTTKVYYTRDSPLTITSYYTTTIPPRTFVSTIIGSRTILRTAGEPTKTVAIQPSLTQNQESTTTVTTTTLIFNSITTTVVRTLVIPNEIQPTKPSVKVVPTQRPSRRPYSPFRPPQRSTTPASVAIKPPGSRTRTPYAPKRPSTPYTPIITEIVKGPKETITVSYTPPPKVIDDDQCRPACNSANKEICKEMNEIYKCECRQGFARINGSNMCIGM